MLLLSKCFDYTVTASLSQMIELRVSFMGGRGRRLGGGGFRTSRGTLLTISGCEG